MTDDGRHEMERDRGPRMDDGGKKKNADFGMGKKGSVD